MLEIFDCPQNSDEWYRARLGIPTASMFATVMAKGKDGGASVTRKAYLLKLAGEILTGEPMENYTNADMERGKVMEDEARDLYSFVYQDEPLTRVGFIRNGNKGCSPDSLVGEKSGLEIKSALAHIQIERLLRGSLPPEHKPQVQGNIWTAERETWDFVSYCPKLPLFVTKVWRDDAYIAELSKAVDQFNEELAEVVQKVRRYGGTTLEQAA